MNIKTCIPCGSFEPAAAPTCSACGEATFAPAAESAPPAQPKPRQQALPRTNNPSRDNRGQ